ncbi:hypothetical protein [Sphingomonas crusticola]|uniref:hypothetical protein n=1 Tax=Sphingomonas crusticola TaxID=1697973 RepID=UPI000E228A34|nr:hypothetical protein [Sphingomonas crusticola]
MASDEQLPEGTDAIIEGAGVSDDGGDDDFATGSSNGKNSAGTSTGRNSAAARPEPEISAIRSEGETAKAALFDRFDDLRGQATDRARDFAQAGKDRATSALDSLVQTVEDAAEEIDQKLGSQYGDYARRAAQGIGNFSETFRDKDVDQLFADARALIAKSPAIAVGTAAALGFVVARLARSGLPEGGSDKDAPKA